MEENPFVQAGALSTDLGEIPHASPFPTPFDQAGAIDGGVDQLKDSGPFIPLCHILEATNNFDDALVIGVGGFGKVYEANIDDGATTTVVAIKPLNAESRQGAQEFWTEVKLLSKFRHTNLVALIGYCNENREKILVYEYMAQGSLANHLYETSTREESGGSRSHLTWEQRLNICLDAACGLDHLHNGIVPGIIHRDVKGKIRDLHTMPTIPRMMPLLTERQDTRSVKLKATYGDTTIKFNLPLTSGISELNKEVLKRLEFELGRFKVEYEDEDGVLILIACDEDVRDYLQFLTSPGNQVIKPLVLKTVPNATNVCKNH